MKKRILALLCGATLAVRLGAQTNDPPARLALIVEDASLQSAADLLTVELSRNNGLVLLERTEIQRVYREQGLSAGSKDYLRLGQLLSADGLLVLEMFREGASQFLGCRLVAVKPGVLLASARFPWPLDDMTHWSAGFVNRLTPLLPKLTVPVKDAVPVSVVNLRATVQSPEAREAERQLTLLVIERLSRERRVFVLERRRMQFLSSEKELAGVDESAFWNGSYLLEGTIDRDGYKTEKMTLSARLVPPNGGAPLPIEISGSRTNFPEIINQLAAKVLENLKLSPTLWNPADEAKQFHEEADWALRFGLYEQAQAAVESAWALGRRTKEVGILRMRAYGEDALAPEGFSEGCNLAVPSVPDETKLTSAIRALEFLCQDATRSTTNPATLDLAWFDVGLRTLRMAARYLEGFYYAAETRRGNEAKLAELRSLARQTAALLKAGQPNGRKAKAVPSGSSQAWGMGEVCRSLEWLTWEEAGIWHDKPEDSLPMYRELLENGYRSSHLPRVIGWSWEDRKRVPTVLKRFIEELCMSTNSDARLEGRFLDMLQTPDDAAGNFGDSEKKLYAELWDQRELLLDAPAKLSVLPRAEGVLRAKRYQMSNSYLPLEHEPLVTFTRRIEEFKVSMQPPKANETASNSVPAQPQRLAGTNAVVRKQQPTTVWPAENPLQLDFIEWTPRSPAFDTNRVPQIIGAVVRGGKIWSWVNYWVRYSSDRSFFRTDPVTGRADEIPFPPQFDQSYYRVWFEVTEDSLYAGSNNRLMRYRFREKNWKEIPLPMEGNVGILGLGSRLYLTTGDSLLEVEPDSGSVQVLASSRRRPVVNELDAVWNQTARLFARSDGRLGIQVTNRLFDFDPVSRAWSSIAALPAPVPLQTHVFTSGEGVQWLLSSYNAPRRLFAFWNNQTQPELLFEQLNPRAPKTTNLVQSYGQPRWNWPEQFRLDYPLFIVEGQKLWMMRPSRLDWGGGVEPIKFEDGRQATLMLFEPGSQECGYVPLVFRKDGSPVNPFGSRNLSPIPLDSPMPFFLATDEGLVVACHVWPGHWLIPKAALQSRLKPMPASLSEQSRNKAESRGRDRTNTVSAVTTNSGQTTKP